MAEASLPIRLMYAGCISYKLEDLFSSTLANGVPMHHHNYLQCSVQQINLRGDQSQHVGLNVMLLGTTSNFTK